MTGGRPGRPGPGRLVRDHPTRVSYAQLGLWGWYLYCFGPTVVLLRDEQGVSRTLSSLHSTAMAVATVAVGVAAAAISRRMGRGAMVRLGSFVTAAAIGLYIAGPALPVTLAGAALAGAGGTLALVGGNAFLGDHFGRDAPVALNEANAIAAFAGLLGPLAVGAAVAVGWGWRPAMGVAAVGFLAVELVRGPLSAYAAGSPAHAPGPGAVPPLEEGAVQAGTAGHPHGHLPGRYWVAWAAAVLLIGVEFCFTLWGSDLLREHGGLGSAAASAALGAIVGGMAVGRVVGSRLVAGRDPERLMAGAIVLAAAGFAVVWATSSAPVMVAGLVVSGLGVSLHWPLNVARGMRAAPGATDRAAAMMSVGAGVASGSAPFVLGALADRVGVHEAFLVVPALMAGALALVLARPVPVEAGR